MGHEDDVGSKPNLNSKVKNVFGTIVDFITNIDSPIKHKKVPVGTQKSIKSESSDYNSVGTEQIQNKDINDFGYAQSDHNVSYLAHIYPYLVIFYEIWSGFVINLL